MATEGGYLQSAVKLNWFVVAPGERVGILIDFSKLAPGTKVIMNNTANAPFPDGDPADPDTVGQIMQFTVANKTDLQPKRLPTILNPTLKGAFPTLKPTNLNRTLPYFEQMKWVSLGDNGPLGVFLNGQRWVVY